MSVELPEPLELRLTEDGLTDTLGPEGRTEAERVTEPAKPLRVPNSTDEVAGAPTKAVREVGLAESVKSTTLTVTCTECDRPPTVPFTVTV